MTPHPKQPVQGDQIARRMDDWRGRLIDLSHRNRLIAYKATQATSLTVVAPSIEELMDLERGRVWNFYLPPEEEEKPDRDASETASAIDRIVLDSRDRVQGRRAGEIEVTEKNPKRIARILDNLAKRSAAEFQDKAIRILYLAVGFLDWHDEARGKDISSPLVLVPVELVRDSSREPYRLRIVEDEDIVVNPSLTEKLSRDASLAMPADWAWEDKSIAAELDEIRAAVAPTGWTVRNDAAIGLFSFQKYVMYRDLLDNESRVASHPVVQSLAHGRLLDEFRDEDPVVPEPELLDDAQAPDETLSILDADASQRQCIEAAKRGRSFVMQGPPGTGKSQTIANLIAESIGQGKKVLFVSEKAAALDVVYNRLAASGLNEYCLMLHGEHAARREVVQSLDASLTSALVARPAMRPDELERLQHLRTLLNSSVELLHLPWPTLGGRSLREVHAELAQHHAAPSVPGAPPAAPLANRAVIDDYQQLQEIFQRLSERWRVADRDFAWRGYDSERFTADDHGRMLAVLGHLAKAIAHAKERAEGLAGTLGLLPPSGPGETPSAIELAELLVDRPEIEDRWLTAEAAAMLTATVAEARVAYEARDSARKSLAEEYERRDAAEFPEGLPANLAAARTAVADTCTWTGAWSDDLGALDEALAALTALPELVATLRERATKAAELLGQPKDSPTPERAEQLAELVDLAFRAEHRPEERWLVAVGLNQAKAVLDEVAPALETYQELECRILSDYKPDALELDGAGLATRFAENYTSVFSKMSGDYRRDAKAIKEERKDGKLPASLIDDLKLIGQAREQGALVDAAGARMKTALGTYANGRRTSVAETRSALEAAEAVARLSNPEAELSAVAARVGIGSTPDPRLAQAADRLRAAAQRVLEQLPAITPFVVGKRDLTALSIDELDARLAEVTEPMTALAGLIAELNRGATEATSFAVVERRAQLVEEAQATAATVADGEGKWRTGLGGRFDGAQSDWTTLAAAATWVGRLFALAGPVLNDRIRALLTGGTKPAEELADLNGAETELRTCVAALTELFEEPHASLVRTRLETGSFEEGEALVAELDSRIDDLLDWTEWRAWRRRAAEREWHAFVDELVERQVEADEVLDAFRRAYWNGRLEALYEEESELAEDLRGGAFQRWVDEFCDLDSRLVASGADRLIEQREKGRNAHVSAAGSEVELLRREARKMRRHLPVRVLLSRIPTLLSDLKPCLMMSPLTVSHFLSAEHTFDLVLFDEASQVPPQDAINCIYRGKQLVVAGDDKQLPPTPFFQVAELDELAPNEEDASTQEDMESVLDACSALLPTHPLRWHYRSRWEPLISFSNEAIYNGSLITFPSVEQESRLMGVGFTHVADGVYDRGRNANNRIEAQVAARRVIDYLCDGTGRSVGVIAFNSSQANAITEELDLLRAAHPELEDRFRGDRLDAVFVKHLEAVQGDERDVILLSVGYGRDASGKFSMNFGPLNKDGGHRRLNVAITRAREKLEVVSSVRAHEFSLSETASRGSVLLRDYIRYAESGGRWHSDGVYDGHGERWPTPLEADIAAAVAELGYEAVPRIGVGTFRIDIGVRDAESPDRFLLGIETDGEGYAMTPTARDRERLRHAVLAGLGWHIHRIWSLDWVRNRSTEIERLAAALAAASAAIESSDSSLEEESPQPVSTNGHEENGDPGGHYVRERVEVIVHELQDSAAAIDLPWTQPYVVARLSRHVGSYEFHETASRRIQTDLLVELLAVEAPFSIDYAIRRLAGCWGIGRAGHRVVSAGRQAISQAVRRGEVEVRGEFLWRPDQTLTAVRVPNPEDPATRRSIEDISPEEIDLALARLREASAGIEDDQLVVQAARVLGFDRTGERIKAAVAARIRRARR